MVAKTQRLETRTLHAVPIKMHLEKSIGIILMMYSQLQLNAAAISGSDGKWVNLTLIVQAAPYVYSYSCPRGYSTIPSQSHAIICVKILRRLNELLTLSSLI